MLFAVHGALWAADGRRPNGANVHARARATPIRVLPGHESPWNGTPAPAAHHATTRRSLLPSAQPARCVEPRTCASLHHFAL